MANAISLVGSSTTNFSNPPINQLSTTLCETWSWKLLVVANYLALPILKSYKLEGYLTQKKFHVLQNSSQIQPVNHNLKSMARLKPLMEHHQDPLQQKWSIWNLINGLSLIYYFWVGCTTQWHWKWLSNLMGFNTAKDLWKAIQRFIWSTIKGRGWFS